MSSDINVQTFSGKVNITSNLLVGTSHLFVDTINNRVGLVTSNPDAGLHVNSNAYVHTDFRVGSGIVMNDTSGRITAGSFVGDGSAMTGINSDSGSWVNGTNSNVHLATSTDNVGIGTSSPSTRLHVETATGVSTNLVKIGSSLNSGSSQSVSGIEFAANPAFFNGDNAQRVPAQITSGFYQGGGADWEDAYISLRTPTNPSSGTINDVLTIRGGNVGIGTTGPGRPLDVHFTGDTGIRAKNTGSTHASVYIDSASGYSYLRFQSSGAEKFWLQSTPTGDLAFRPSGSGPVMDIKNNGNVGIGTTSPSQKLDVVGGPTKSDGFILGTSNNLYTPGCIYTDSNWGMLFRSAVSSPGIADFLFNDYAGNQMMVIDGGNVGIGTNSPGYKLEVNGTSQFNGEMKWALGHTSHAGYSTNKDWYIRSGSSSGKVIIQDSGGNVGVGTASPGAKLDVNGNLRVTTGILDTSWCSGSWLQTCTQSPTVTVYSNNGGGPMSTPGHGGTGMGGNRGRFTAKKAGNYLISCCAVHMGRGGADASGSSLLVVFDAVGTNWNLNNVINTYDEIIDLRVAPTAEEAYTFACQVYMNVGHYFSFRVHSSGYIDNNAKLLCSAALVR